MSAHIKLLTLEYPRFQGDIRLEHPEIGEEFVCPETYAPVEYVEIPEFDNQTQTAYELPPTQTDGVWRMVWAVRDFTAQEIEDMRLWKEQMQNQTGVHSNVDAPGATPDVIG